jgi:hypothetical protein
MARLSLPERFVIHSSDQFVGALDRVTAWYWYRHSKGDVDQERNIGLAAKGSIDAMHWLAGIRSDPPGYSTAWVRTRANLLALLRKFELLYTDKLALLAEDSEIDPWLDESYVAGVLHVLGWAVGIEEDYPGVDMHPEDVQAARRYFGDLQARQQHAA